MDMNARLKNIFKMFAKSRPTPVPIATPGFAAKFNHLKQKSHEGSSAIKSKIKYIFQSIRESMSPSKNKLPMSNPTVKAKKRPMKCVFRDSSGRLALLK